MQHVIITSIEGRIETKLRSLPRSGKDGEVLRSLLRSRKDINIEEIYINTVKREGSKQS